MVKKKTKTKQTKQHPPEINQTNYSHPPPPDISYSYAITVNDEQMLDCYKAFQMLLETVFVIFVPVNGDHAYNMLVR